MRVTPKALVRRLTPTATRMLESAVRRAVASNHREIGVEHFLAAMLEGGDSDCALFLGHFDRSPERMLAEVEAVIEGFRTDSQGRPVFASTLFDWIEDAWVFASIEQGATQLRTGALLVQLLRAPGRYCSEEFSTLAGLTEDQLRGAFDVAIAASSESTEIAACETNEGGRDVGGEDGRGEQALSRYTRSYTAAARDGKIDRVVAREQEIQQLIDILVRRRKNNPIIVGESGVGKTALVEGLALAIAAGDVPESLKAVDLRELDMSALQAGASVKGEFEARLKAVIGQVQQSSTPIILFIDEAHSIIGAGGQSGSSSDAANILKPALARGELRTIAATTWHEYKKYFEKDAALARRFQVVKVDEPSIEDTIIMLRGLVDAYERDHGVVILEEALVAAASLGGRYISGRLLPDKAVDLLDTAAARVRLSLGTKPVSLLHLENRVQSLRQQETRLARDIEQGFAADEQALTAIRYEVDETERACRKVTAEWQAARDACNEVVAAEKALGEHPGSVQAKDALARARQALSVASGTGTLVRLQVDEQAVAEVVATSTGIPVGRLKSATLQTALSLESVLGERVKGQDHALSAIAEAVRMSYASIRDPNVPIAVLLFVGPSGVGKTETALALADILYGGERFMTTINMSEFQEKHSVSRLIGSPPGYVGFGEGGILTEAVRHRPYSVVLLDECEKADLDVMNLFYQVFDKGVLSDGEGRTVNFRNTLVIATSNLGSNEIVEAYGANPNVPVAGVIDAVRPALRHHFKAALLGRMAIVPFAPLSDKVLQDIILLKLERLSARLRHAHEVEVQYTDDVVQKLVDCCTDPASGARNVDRVLRGSLMPAMARELLVALAAGDSRQTLKVGVNESGGWNVDLR